MQELTPKHFEDLFVREINRCYARIEECEIREAQLEPGSDPKFRATNDRDRDRAFIALRRAMKALKELRAELAEMPASVPTASNVIPMPVKALPVQALPAIARNSLAHASPARSTSAAAVGPLRRCPETSATSNPTRVSAARNLRYA